jgi:alpha-1,6-mannosyltransferase
MLDLLGEDYRLMMIAAGAYLRPHRQVIGLDYVRDPRHLARLIASCDAFVHANDQEPFGLVVLEALASGVPVVGPGTGGVGELIDDSVGQVAHRANAQGMAEAIDALFSRDLQALSQAARDRAQERHGWSRTFETLMQTYGRLTGLNLDSPALLAS